MGKWANPSGTAILGQLVIEPEQAPDIELGNWNSGFVKLVVWWAVLAINFGVALVTRFRKNHKRYSNPEQ